MGMELASKKDGKLTKTVAPPGYTNYVGNEKYGHWVQRDGGSFWEFYGKYAFFSSMFRMTMFPIRYSYWNDYHRNYYGYGRGYYGPSYNNGRRMYGTNSAYNSNNKTARWNNKTSDFKSNVRSKVQRSSAASKKSANRVSSSKRRSSSYQKKTTRSSSRYSRSSTRSRGGGFGK
jgi:hypothetical protein